MGKSVFLRRIIVLVAAALLLSGILSAVLFNAVMQYTYVNMQAAELLPIGHMVANVVQESLEDDMQLGMHPFFGDGNKSFLGAQTHIYDPEGNSLSWWKSKPNRPDNGGPGQSPPEHIQPFPDEPNQFPGNGEPGEIPLEEKKGDKDLTPIILPVLEQALAGSEVVTTEASLEGDGYLVVGVPVWDEAGESILGAVVFTKQISEMYKSLHNLRITVMMSTLLTFLIMLVPGYFAARKLTVPLMQMRDVSLHMAKGDFSRRADESQKGEIGELAVSINRFAQESQRLEKTRQDYVSNVSHELRTPIAAIRAMSETLADGIIQSEDKKQHYYTLIMRESMRLSRLVNDLLELSRLQAGDKALVKKTAFAIGDTLRHCADIYGEMANDAGVTLVLDAQLETLGTVTSNADRIEQLLVILLDNAITHTREDGTITLRAVSQPHQVELSVVDQGEGIPPEDLPYVFDRFYKVDKAHSSGGTGLGLSIARELTDLLGETIAVESTPNQGSTFTFTVGRYPDSRPPSGGPGKDA